MTIFCSINQKRVIRFIICRREKNTITTFPYTVKEWSNLYLEIRKFVLYKFFENSILIFTTPTSKSLFSHCVKVSKYEPEKTPYMVNFHAVSVSDSVSDRNQTSDQTKFRLKLF